MFAFNSRRMTFVAISALFLVSWGIAAADEVKVVPRPPEQGAASTSAAASREQSAHIGIRCGVSGRNGKDGKAGKGTAAGKGGRGGVAPCAN